MSTEWINFLDSLNSTIAKWDEEGCDFPVFRGHADQDWHLEPSLMRLKKDIDPEEYERLESALYFDCYILSKVFTAKQFMGGAVRNETPRIAYSIAGLVRKFLHGIIFCISRWCALSNDLDVEPIPTERNHYERTVLTKPNCWIKV